MAGNKYWLLILDDATDMVFSHFLKSKSDTTNKMLNFIMWMKERKTPVKTIRLNNSGENMKLRDNTRHMNINYEFTSPNTPQQNGRVERKFSILYDYMRSMINTAKLPTHLLQMPPM
jgi:transposase InsO family protein